VTTVREVTYDLLRALGMTTVFGNPGSTEAPFLRDFPADFRYVLSLQEASTVAMADGFAQATGRPALVNLHTAPGVGNAMGNIIAAWHNKTPLVVTAGQQTRAMMAMEPWLYNRDAVDLPKPYVKWSSEPPRAEDVPAAVERAFHTAMQQPRGPVFLSIPMDDWDAPAEPRTPRTVSDRTAPDPTALHRVADLLGTSKRSAIIAGAEIDRSDGWEEAVALAERTRAAVYSAPVTERVGFPEGHPLFQGPLPFAQKPISDTLSGYDVVLVVGAPVFRYYPHVPGPATPEGTRLLHLTDDPDEAARAVAGDAVVGDVRLALERLVQLVPASDRAAPTARPRPAPPPARAPIGPAFLAHTLAQALPADAVIAAESPTNAPALRDYLRPSRPGGYYSAASGGLGWALPAAVGLQLAHPERRVVAVVGDGSSLYSIQALWTAAQLNLPLVVIVPNNAQYAILKAFTRFQDTSGVPGLDLPGLDIAGIARGFGYDAHRVDRPEDLAGALRDALAACAPVLVEVVVDPAIPPLI